MHISEMRLRQCYLYTWWFALTMLLIACQRSEPAAHYSTPAANAPRAFNADDFPASTMQVSGVHAKRVEDLTLLCKVWGFLKYYHPNAARPEVYWDGRLLDMLKRVPMWKNDSIRDVDLQSLISGLGAFPMNTSAGAMNDSMVALNADLKWIDSSSIAPSLRALLHNVEHARRDTCSAFMEVGASTWTIEGEIQTPPICLRNAGYRLLTLFRFWNAVHYLFPYRTMMDRPWDEALSSFIPRVAESDTVRLFEYAMLELATWMCDSHASVFGYQTNVSTMFGNTSLCMDLKFINGKAYVVRGWSDAFTETNVKPGDEVLAIAGRPVPLLVDSIKRYLPTSNISTMYRDIAQLIVRTDAQNAQVKVRRGTRTLTVPVLTRAYGPNPVPERVERFFRRVGTGNYGLVDMQFFTVDSLKARSEDMRACDGLIVDLRGRPGAFENEEVGAFFLPWPTTFAKFAIPDCTMPGRFTYFTHHILGDRSNGHYKGKLVIMVDEQTQSSAEYWAMTFASAPGAIVVGSQTAGADGDISRLPLPGGGMLTFTGRGVSYPDGGITQRQGLRISKQVRATSEALTANDDDEVFNEAMRLVRMK